jgi:hypothetical protein
MFKDYTNRDPIEWEEDKELKDFCNPLLEGSNVELITIGCAAMVVVIN